MEIDKIGSYGLSSPKNQLRSMRCPKHEESYVMAVCTLPDCKEGILICPECSLENPEHAVAHKAFIEKLHLFLSKRADKLAKVNELSGVVQHKNEITQYLQEVNKHISDIDDKFSNYSKLIIQDMQIYLDNINAKVRELATSKDFANLPEIKERLVLLESLVNKHNNKQFPTVENPINIDMIQNMIQSDKDPEAFIDSDHVNSSLASVKSVLEELQKKPLKFNDVENYYGTLRASVSQYFKNILTETTNLKDLSSVPVFNWKEQSNGMFLSKNSDITNYSMPGNKPADALTNNGDISSNSKNQSSYQSATKDKSQKSSIAPDIMKVTQSKEDIELVFHKLKQTLTAASSRLLDDVADTVWRCFSNNETFVSGLNDKLRTVKTEVLTNIEIPKRNSFVKDLFHKILTIIPEKEFTKIESKPSQYYHGALKNNLRDGVGLTVISGRSIYLGEYVNGIASGHGMKISEDGEFYEGRWEEGECQGTGYLCLSDSECEYYGEFSKSQKDGKGYEKRKDGTTYIGYFQNNIKDGNGVSIWAIGERYEGLFKENRIEGSGIYTWADGSIYIGDWKNSMMHGKGYLTDADGGQYVGDFKEDLKNGYGCFTWKDKWIYRGTWVKGVQNGIGIEIEPDGKQRLGQWSNGELNVWLEE
jgi:hypothetical protein